MKLLSCAWTLTVCLVVILTLSLAVTPAAAQSPPTFQSAHFLGGAGDQDGRAIAIGASDVYIAGNVFPPGNVQGLLAKYSIPASAPVWSTVLLGGSSVSVFNALALTSTMAYPVGLVLPPSCGAVDGVGDTEIKTLLARYTPAGALIGCQSANFFIYTGGEIYQAALATNEGGSDFIYAATERAEHCGFSTNPFVLAKYDAFGALLIKKTEPGVSFSGFTCGIGGSRATGLTELNGNIYLAGSSSLAGEPGVSGFDGVAHPVLMKFDISLNRIWKALSTNSSAGVFNAVTASGGFIYAVGNTHTPVFVGIPFYPTAASGSRDFLIEKYDETGMRLWTVTSGGADDDVLTGVVGIGSRLFAVGYTRSSGAGGADAVILEINPATGATLSTTHFGGVQDDRANGMATDGKDLYVVGESRSFASAEGNAVGQNDLVLLRYTLNQAPNAICEYVTVSAGPDCTANASIDNGSFDPDSGDTITLAQNPPGPYPLGTTSVTLTVTDNHGASSECTANVTVVDDTPPAITGASATPSSLWPPNHKMVNVTVNYTTTDNCGPVTCALSVASNEPINGLGDGDTAPDWEVVDAHHVRLRAERSGIGNGRVYTITITCADDSGNSSSKTVTVNVPQSQR